MSILPKLNGWFSDGAIKGAQNKVKMGLPGLFCLLPACSCPEERPAGVSCPGSDVLVQLGRGARMGKCPWSLARHRSRTGAGARAAGWGWGQFQAVQVRLKRRERAPAHSLGVPGKRRRDYQRRVRYEALESQRCYAFCACKLLAVHPLPGSRASQQLFLGALSVLSFGVTSVTALLFVRKKDVFSSGIVILAWSTGGQKTRYSLPQLPLAEQYLWVDSKPVRISKTNVLLVCMTVILRASWHCKSTVPWQSSNYAESCWEVTRLLATSICLLLVAQALPAEGATSPVPRCFSEYRISSLGFSGSCGLWVLHLVSKGCELLAALLCTYTTWPQGRNSCLWALWNIPDPYPITNNNNNNSNKLIYINYKWLYILQMDN